MACGRNKRVISGLKTRRARMSVIAENWLTNTAVSSSRPYRENKVGFFDVKGVSAGLRPLR
jgi:flagellar basal body rod protein FlgC